MTKLGHMPLNCLIFQDDIARLNSTLDQARKGARGDPGPEEVEIESWKIKICISWIREVQRKTRREAEQSPVMMGSHIMEESPDEKYLGDQIQIIICNITTKY